MMLLLKMVSDPTPSHLTVNLHRTANPTVREVSCAVFPPGVSLGAAPGSTEASRRGAGVVDHALEDEGELAGCRAGGDRGARGGGGGPSSRTGGRVTVAPGSSHVVSVNIGGGGTPGLLEPSSQGALAVGLALQYTAINVITHHHYYIFLQILKGEE